MTDRDKSTASSSRSRRYDVGSALIEKIRALLGPGYRIAMLRERPWASINFSGTRYRLAVHPDKSAEPIESDILAERLDALDFDLTGYFVADTLVDGRGSTNRPVPPSESAIMVELLVIIDPFERAADPAS